MSRADVAALLKAAVDKPSAHVETPSETDTEKTIWDFFTAKGLNAFAVGGIMGNLFAESALRPENLQNTYEKKLCLSDLEYTKAVDDGSYTNFVHDSAGYGLAQWTYWSRKQELLEYAQKVGKSIADLGMQLEFMWIELQAYQLDLGDLGNKLLDVVNALFAVLAILGIVTDPTTAGVKDSEQAMTYTEPKK